MATVTSLTEARIEELLSGYVGVALSQDEINALVSQLVVTVGSLGADLDEFNNVVRPQLEEDVVASSIALNDVTTNSIPDLQLRADNTELTVNTLSDDTIPTLQSLLTANIINVIESPHVYVQPEAPTNPDENERYLVVGDVWHDDDDDNRERLWNGVEWSTFAVDIPDLVETIMANLSPEHALFHAPVTGALPVTNGSNITPEP